MTSFRIFITYVLLITDVNLFYKFSDTSILKTQYCNKDISIFSHYSAGHQHYWYAALLQENRGTDYGTIEIYRHNYILNTWRTVYSEFVPNPWKIFTLSYSESTLLVVAHKNTPSDNALSQGITVYILDDNIRLHLVQTLDTPPSNNVILWKTEHHVFLTFAADYIIIEDGFTVEIDIPIYIWKGNHFDLHQYISTSNPKQIISFHIGLQMFLAIANHQNNFGETKIFSEIFKFDDHENKFTLHQRLPSDGAVDLHFFNFQEGTNQESFLVIVNSGNTDVIYKFEDNYFTPFQELFTSGPTRWYSVNEKLENVMLLSISETLQINILQYNGWNFVTIPFVHDNLLQTSMENIVKQCQFYNNSVLVISDETRSTYKLKQPIFKHNKNMDKFVENMHSWCDEVKELISYSDLYEYNNKENSNQYITSLKQISILKNENLYIDKTLNLNYSSVDKIEISAIYADDTSLDINVIQNMNLLYKFFRLQTESLQFLEDILSDIMFDNETFYFDSLQVNNLEFDCFNIDSCQFDNVEMLTLNNKDMNEYQKVVLYTEVAKAFYGGIEFIDLIVEDDMDVAMFNEKTEASDIGSLLQQVAAENGLIVQKNVHIISDGVSVNGLVDNIQFSPQILLLKNGDQILKGNFDIPSINTGLLDTEQINGLTFADLKDIMKHENKTVDSKLVLSELNAENVVIEGLINNYNFQSLLFDALKLTGNQIVNAKFNISHLETIDFSTSPNTPVISELISIDKGTFNINQDVKFEKMNVNNIIIEERLNNINVEDDELLVVLLDSPQMQKITGDKLFHNVELMGPINLQTKINSPSLDRKKPVTMTEKAIVLNGNFTIRGNVSVERILTCGDLRNKGNDMTVKELQLKGLKLSEKNIQTPVIFTQPMEVKNVRCNKINGLKPSSWISNNRNKIITVTGKKIFTKDLNIQGNCQIIKEVNNINPKSLDKSVLKTIGDQIIDGRIFFNNLSLKELNCLNITFDGLSIEKFLTYSDDRMFNKEMTINSGANVRQNLKINKLNVLKTISGHFIQDMVHDTVMKSSSHTDIYNYIVMKDLLNVQHLDLENIFGIKTKKLYLSQIWNREVKFKDLFLNYPIDIQNIIFETTISDIPKSEFGNSWLLTTGDQILHGNQIFETLISRNVYVESEKINEIILPLFFNNLVWIHTDAYLNEGIFKNNILIKGNVNVYGSINDLSIPRDLVLRTSIVDQHVYSQKTIKNFNVSKQFKTHNINGLNLKQLCTLTHPKLEETWPNLYINGSLHFNNEPLINMLHNEFIDTLMKNVWLTDTVTKLQGNNIFNVMKLPESIKGSVTVKGVNLKWLSENYFSLSRNQEISGVMEIPIMYGKIVCVLNGTTVGGYINGINLEETYQNTPNT